MQSLICGATSYEEQSLKDILEDIERWIDYSNCSKKYIFERKAKLEKTRYWFKVPIDFRWIVESTISIIDAFLYDLGIVKRAIETNTITKREIHLLGKICKKAWEYDENYPKYFEENDVLWHDYDNDDFKIAEEIYIGGKSYFGWLFDAKNAANRLEDYIMDGNVINNTVNINAPVTDVQIQAGTTNSSQTKTTCGEFDYEDVRKVLIKIQGFFEHEDFDNDFGENAKKIKATVNDTIDMIDKREKPTKIKNALRTLKDLSIGVFGSIIASGIMGLISPYLS